MTRPEITRVRRNHTARELADRIGVSTRTVYRLMAEERGSYEGRAAERRARILELHTNGVGVRAIARELDISPALVSLRLKEAKETTPVPTDS